LLLRSRTLAKEACERGKVTLNGAPTKGSREVAAGDRIRLDLGVRVLELEILRIPGGQLSRREAAEHYRLVSEEKIDARE
jgi:ribosomal 50S subunit-recycling heat shock protein